ncbi:MAG: NADH-quinone oxidoreductase subunit A [Myxococcales bacterium]|nr:NADH-quinone oxidoreductase subunit A [Myxococcales bacterium]
MNAFAALLAAAASVFALFGLAGAIRRETDPTRRPWTTTLPVLGGKEPGPHAWHRYHVRYYPMTLLFLAFEMEMMFMYPWAVVYVREGAKALVEMGMFLGILAIGILYAWREGALRWQ